MENHKSSYPGSVTYHFFYSGPFSNWHKCAFEYKGKIFNCSEQAMMWEKAMMFDDIETASQILKKTNPRDQKQLGRQVANYDEQKWNENRYSIVKEICRCKFEQNPELKKELLKYKGCSFVEASPFDRIWGIGYDQEHAIENMFNWGENLLGRLLTELSNEIQ